ncbi:MAG: hypothetical protein ACK4TI_03605, partial [Nitrososphaerales archaeon]
RGAGIGIKGGYLPKNVEVKEGPYGPAYMIGEYTGFEIRRDLWGVESIWAPNRTYTYTYHKHPLQYIPLEEYKWPEVSVEDFNAVVKARRIYEDYCLCGGVEHMWEIAWQLVGNSCSLSRATLTPYWMVFIRFECSRLSFYARPMWT